MLCTIDKASAYMNLVMAVAVVVAAEKIETVQEISIYCA